MTSSFGIRAAALPSWRRLHLALAELDRPTPCQANPDAWTEDTDPDVTEAAARLCEGWCPVLAECDTFATANKETAGIWAGRDRTPTRRAVIVDAAGPSVELGPWKFSPDDARLLAISLNVLADLADGTTEVTR